MRAPASEGENMASEVESENDIIEREEQHGEYSNNVETSDATAKLQEIDQEDSSLLDGALGEGDVEADESALSILDETGDGDGVQIEDPEIEAIKARVKEMEEEAEKLKEMQGEVEKQLMGSKPAGKQFPTPEEKQDADLRSVFVGNVDFQSTAEELGQHFHGCGPVNRVTILCDKFSGHPKGYAYIEFSEKDAVNNALALDESLFRGRQIKVTAKRTNKPGLNRGRGRGRGRGMFRGAGMMMGFNPYFGGYMVRMPSRGRGRGFRGRAKSNWYAPY